MPNLPPCPQCNSALTYEDGPLFVCPECANEWSRDAAAPESESAVTRDANGNVLQDGDTVTVIMSAAITTLTAALTGSAR